MAAVVDRGHLVVSCQTNARRIHPHEHGLAADGALLHLGGALGARALMPARDGDVILRPSEAYYARGLAAQGGLGDCCATRVEPGVS